MEPFWSFLAPSQTSTEYHPHLCLYQVKKLLCTRVYLLCVALSHQYPVAFSTADAEQQESSCLSRSVAVHVPWCTIKFPP